MLSAVTGNNRRNFLADFQDEARIITQAATLIDKNGVIFGWVFPALLDYNQNVSFFYSQVVTADKNERELISSTNGVSEALCISKDAQNWRTTSHRFLPRNQTRILPTGSINLSGGWYARGRGPKVGIGPFSPTSSD